jgi:hypothetical protein
MLYVFFGTDTHKIADQAHRLVVGLRAKRPDAQVFTFESDSFTTGDLDELVTAQGLFVEKHVVVLKNTFDTVERRDLVLARIEQLASSQNIFIITEGKLLADQKRTLEKHADKIEEHNKIDGKRLEFNIFALGDALGARDRRGLWLGYLQARRAGLAPEAIQGTLHWTVKGLLAARDASSPDAVGQKLPMFGKNKRAAQNFTRAELVGLSHSLIAAYHEAHRGKYELDTALERLCLNI